MISVLSEPPKLEPWSCQFESGSDEGWPSTWKKDENEVRTGSRWAEGHSIQESQVQSGRKQWPAEILVGEAFKPGKKIKKHTNVESLKVSRRRFAIAACRWVVHCLHCEEKNKRKEQRKVDYNFFVSLAICKGTGMGGGAWPIKKFFNPVPLSLRSCLRSPFQLTKVPSNSFISMENG